MEPIRSSVWRSAKWNTARSVRAVVIARAEYQGYPPRVARGSALQAAIASSENHTVTGYHAGAEPRHTPPSWSPVLLPGDGVPASGIGFERHDRCPGVMEGQPSYAASPAAPTGGSVQQSD